MLRVIQRILKISGPYEKRLKWAFILNVLEQLSAMVPLMLVLFFLIAFNLELLNMNRIWSVMTIMILSVLIRTCLRRAIDGLQSDTGYRIFAEERIKMGNHLIKLPMGFYSDGSIGQITSVLTSDLVFIEGMGMEVLSKIVAAHIHLVVGCILLIVLDWRIGISFALFITASTLVLNWIQRIGVEMSYDKQKTESQMVEQVISYVKGMAVSKAFHLAGERSKAMQDSFRTVYQAMITFERRLMVPSIIFESLVGTGIAVLIWISLVLFKSHGLDLPKTAMVILFSFEMFAPLYLMAGNTPQLRINEAALNRYDSVMSNNIIINGSEYTKLEHYDIVFDHVTFAYDHTPVIKDISFKASQGKMTALVGRSGSGKSTIVNLIARFWDVNEGEVRIGGVAVNRMNCDTLLKYVSVVFQDVYLFKDTILSNIRMGNPTATYEEVVDACKKARCHEFIMKLENRYETVIGEAGSTLSGGEKQRISIARAILKDAPIVLLDEATASVDPDNERYIQEAIDQLVKHKTLIVIAHRLSTIQKADQIIVLDEGSIVECGHHEELIHKNGLYASLWERRSNATGWRVKRLA